MSRMYEKLDLIILKRKLLTQIVQYLDSWDLILQPKMQINIKTKLKIKPEVNNNNCGPNKKVQDT